MNTVRMLLLALALLGMHAAARADSCTATMTDVDFGVHSTVGAADAYATGTLTITCSWTLLTGIPPLLLFPNVAICANFNTSVRTLNHGSNTIAFGLYRDSSYAPAALWGSPAVPSSPTPISTSFGGLIALGTMTRTIAVYGKVPASAIEAAATTSGGDTLYTANLNGSINYSFYGLVAQPCASSGNSAAFAFAARATVSNNCMINTDALAFGTQGLLRSDVRTTAAMRVQCTKDNPYRIALSGGSVANNPAARRMKHGASAATIGYQISATLDGAPWGDGSNGTATLAGTGSGALQTITLYGRVPAQATPAPGDYKDTVMATIIF
ncbi:Csu type fimbrial protein [Massilia soli]|uniref:Spore coat U domain-containing protein n=1 Tax=Massilia soli TaxID=2792854 RepID=A0ABS7SUA1_9BURK|nr:spore coat U domain-containing protein [Massilia soli]MBZ2209524.1 spore coat U domain-containing protein [Massilia soli]